jgi:hypothetical protein
MVEDRGGLNPLSCPIIVAVQNAVDKRGRAVKEEGIEVTNMIVR